MSLNVEYNFSGTAGTGVAGKTDLLGNTFATLPGGAVTAGLNDCLLTGSGQCYASVSNYDCVGVDVTTPANTPTSTDYSATGTTTYTSSASLGYTCGPAINMSATANTYYSAVIYGNHWYVFKKVAGTVTPSNPGSAIATVVSTAYTVTIARTTTGGVATVTATYGGTVVATLVDSTPITSIGSAGWVLSGNTASPTDSPLFSAFSGNANVAGTGATPPTITSPVAYRVFQRTESMLGTIAITGTNASSAVQTIQANWSGSGSNWTTIATNVAAGATFSGSLTGQPSNAGTLTIRYAGATSITTSVGPIGVGELLLPGGQSNGVGQGTSPQTALTPSFFCSVYNLQNNWEPIADPVFNFTGAVDPIYAPNNSGGSVWPKVGSILTTVLQCPVGFILVAYPGSGLTVATPAWLPIPSVNDGTTLFGAMVQRFEQAGGSARAVLWLQGETDGSGGVTTAAYFAGLQTLVAAIQAQMGIQFMPATLYQQSVYGNVNSLTYEGYINAAIVQSWTEIAGVVRGPNLNVITADAPPHVTTTAGLDWAAGLWAEQIINTWFSPAVFPPAGDVLPAAGEYGPNGNDYTGTLSSGGSATALALQLGAASGYTGQVIDLVLTLVGGSTLTSTLNYSIGGLTTSAITGSITSGTSIAVTNFTVGSAGTLTPTLSITSGGNSGMTTSVSPTSFSATALPSGGVTLSQLQTALASGITTLAANGVDNIVVETGVNARQALSPILAACAGVVSGAGTGSVTIKGGNVATTRITATTDTNGNRASVTLAIPT